MTFALRVADITTRVVCDDASLALRVSETARRFLAPEGEPDTTLTVATRPQLDEPAGERLFDSSPVWRLYRDKGDLVFSFTSAALVPAPYKIARFDPSFTAGTVWLDRRCLPADRAVDPFEFPLAELMMINLLARGRGVEIHGCGVIDRDGRAWLFAGQSGAGKSTIARLWDAAGATVLSDDRLVVRPRDGQVWMYGTPWHGEEEFGAPGEAPLAGIYFLDHAPDHHLRPMRAVEAMAQLFACSFPPFYDEAGLNFTVDLMTRIVEQVACLELSFVPDASVVTFIRSRT